MSTIEVPVQERSSPDRVSVQSGGLRDELAAVPAGAIRERMLRQYLREELAAALEVEPAALEVAKPLADMGFTSATAVALRERFESGLGIKLPLTLFFAHPTLGSLAPELLRRMRLDR